MHTYIYIHIYKCTYIHTNTHTLETIASGLSNNAQNQLTLKSNSDLSNRNIYTHFYLRKFIYIYICILETAARNRSDNPTNSGWSVNS
jgi:hypothetical protein